MLNYVLYRCIWFGIILIHLHIHPWSITESTKYGLSHTVLQASNTKESMTVYIQEAHKLGVAVFFNRTVY